MIDEINFDAMVLLYPGTRGSVTGFFEKSVVDLSSYVERLLCRQVDPILVPTSLSLAYPVVRRQPIDAERHATGTAAEHSAPFSSIHVPSGRVF